MRPPEDTASHHGREVTFPALGQSWTVARFDLDLLARWIDWARPQIPDPLEVAEAEVLRLAEKIEAARTDETMGEDRKHLRVRAWQEQIERISRLAMAEAAEYLSITSPEIQSLMNSPEGAGEIFRLLLEKHHPGITHEQAVKIVSDLGPSKTRQLMAQTQGKGPPKNPQRPASSRKGKRRR